MEKFYNLCYICNIVEWRRVYWIEGQPKSWGEGIPREALRILERYPMEMNGDRVVVGPFYSRSDAENLSRILSKYISVRVAVGGELV